MSIVSTIKRFVSAAKEALQMERVVFNLMDGIITAQSYGAFRRRDVWCELVRADIQQAMLFER
jgi:hypothetical protein